MVMRSAETALQASFGAAHRHWPLYARGSLAPQFGALIGCLTRPLKEPGCACGAVLAFCARRFGHLWVPGARRMAQDWAGFSEEELRRLKQNKGKKYLRAGVESRV